MNNTTLKQIKSMLQSNDLIKFETLEKEKNSVLKGISIYLEYENISTVDKIERIEKLITAYKSIHDFLISKNINEPLHPICYKMKAELKRLK